MQRIHHQTRHAARTENVSGQIPEQITEKVREQPSQIRLTPTPSPAAGPENRHPAQDSKQAGQTVRLVFSPARRRFGIRPFRPEWNAPGAVSDGHRAARPVRTPPAASVRSAPRSSRPLPARDGAARRPAALPQKQHKKSVERLNAFPFHNRRQITCPSRE